MIRTLGYPAITTNSYMHSLWISVCDDDTGILLYGDATLACILVPSA